MVESAHKVFVTDVEAKSALPVLESLRRKGIEIHVGSERRTCAGFLSRYPARRFLYPSPAHEPALFLERILELVGRYEYETIIPIGDEVSEILAANMEKFPATTRIPLPDSDTLLGGRDKARTIKMAMENHIPCPRTWFPDEEDIEEIRDRIDYPVLIKPAISAGARGIVYIDSREKLIPEYGKTSGEYGKCIIQEFISHEGMQYKADVLVDGNCEPRAGIVYSKLRYYPVKGGSSTLIRTVKHEVIMDNAVGLLKAMNWYGFADFDFIVDPRDNTAKIIEINARLPESFRITLAAGIDFPHMLYRLALGQGIETCMEYELDVYSRFLLGDILWFLKSADRFKAEPGFFRFFRKNQNYYTFSLKDPGFGIGYLLDSLLLLFNRESVKARFSRGW
jgi:predicted ATP-grasp superfamily ATP-dependent carboligase